MRAERLYGEQQSSLLQQFRASNRQFTYGWVSRYFSLRQTVLASAIRFGPRRFLGLSGWRTVPARTVTLTGLPRQFPGESPNPEQPWLTLTTLPP